MGEVSSKCTLQCRSSSSPFSLRARPNLRRERGKTSLDQTNGRRHNEKICTLQLCFRQEGAQLKPTIIFRGQGMRLSRLEREAWDKRVTVMFQAKAWADRKFVLDWCTQHFIPFVTSELPLNSEKVLFCDNLDAQVQSTFLALLRSINCFRWLLPTKS